MSVIEVKDVSVIYESKNKSTVALDNLSAVFGEGINVIVGYSGCGKTTLLKAICGQVEYDGQISIDGIDIECMATQDRNLAYVSQEYVLYPQYTVFDNIAFPLKQLGAGRDEIVRRVKEIASLTGLSACLTRNPKHISGGQQQRVAIARALVKQPSVCLMDEPFSNVDEQTSVSMRVWLKSVFRTIGCTVVYVTHDFKEAYAMADALYVMDGGKVVASGTPKAVFESGNEVVEALKVGSFAE